MAERPGILFRFELLDALEQLDPADAGTLFVSAMRYGKYGDMPTFQNAVVSVIWPFVKSAVDRDAETYSNKMAQRRYAVYVREAKRKDEPPMTFDEWKVSADIENERSIIPMISDIHTQIQSQSQTQTQSHIQEQEQDQALRADKPPTPTRKKFVPPSLEEVTEYIRERGSRVDPQGFLDFYASKGWMGGRSPMKDWKAACRRAESWERWSRPQQDDKNRLRTDADYSDGESFV